MLYNSLIEQSLENLRVFVYWNLHKSCFSLKALEGPYKGRVVAHASCLWLRTPTFKVSQAGRARVLREKAKNVHAGVVGYICKSPELNNPQILQAYYNPYKVDCFIDKKTGETLTTGEFVNLVDRQVFVINKTC